MPTTIDLERGRVVSAIGILRTRPTEPWTLNALADEVGALPGTLQTEQSLRTLYAGPGANYQTLTQA